MNYITEINNFRKYTAAEPLHTATQGLWFLLMHINNLNRWSEWFQISNIFLSKELCIAEKTMIKHRELLIGRGLIYYKSQQRKKNSGIYHVVSIADVLEQKGIETGVKITAVSEDESQTGVKITAVSEDESQTGVKITAVSEDESQTGVKITAVSENEGQTGVKITADSKTAVKITDIYKHSNNNNNSIRDSEFVKIKKFYDQNIRPITPFEADQLIEWMNEFDADIIILALQKCVENDARKISYCNSILGDWSKKNLRSLDAINASERNFKSKGVTKAINKTQGPKNKFHDFNQRPKFSDSELEEKLGIKRG
jgi:DnaD/phage-associated family protein